MIIENIINNKWFQFLLLMQCFIPIITNLAIFLSLSALFSGLLLREVSGA